MDNALLHKLCVRTLGDFTARIVTQFRRFARRLSDKRKDSCPFCLDD